MRFAVLTAALLLAAPLVAPRAARAEATGGFTDCAKASAPDEKAICGNIELVQQDARMVTMFKIAKDFVGMGTRGSINDAQAAWLSKRHSCKTDIQCLHLAYGVRVRQLKKILDDARSHGPY